MDKTLVRIRFLIQLPAMTPAEAKIFVAGSLPQLGGVWNPAGLQARRVAELRYEAEAELPKGGTLEFKITRGDWNSVEVKHNGRERSNRSRKLSRSGSVEVTVGAWGDLKRRQRGPVGLNRQHSVPSVHLKGERHVMVHLPPGYESGNRAYPLLLMHDGQNLFDDATSYAGVKWAVDEAVDKLVARRQMEPIVVVGVRNSSDRMREYHPERAAAHAYERFLLEELVPYLEAHYRITRERMGVMGSSMGGIISLHLIERRRDVLTRAGVVSPSIFAGGGVARRLGELPLPAHDRRIWMDMGTLEGGQESLRGLQQFQQLLRSSGWTEEQLRCEVIQRGRHHEADWARRIPKILMHLYPPRPG